MRLEPGSKLAFGLAFLINQIRPIAQPDQVRDTRLCTALEIGGRPWPRWSTCSPRLAGVGLTQAEIWIEGHEIPLLDGSALPWVEAIAEAGLVDLGPRLHCRPGRSDQLPARRQFCAGLALRASAAERSD